MRLTPILVLLAVACAAQTTKKERDLKFDTTPPGPGAAAVKPPEREFVSEPRTPSIPRSYALVVGVGGYKNLEAKHHLQFPERDAEAIYSILISPEGGNFRAENVKRFVGANATLANIRSAIEQWLPSVSQDDDRVLIYFAGHGFVKDGKGYLAPYDVDLAKLESTAYPMDALGSAIGGKIKGKWKVLLTDSCHSGAITPEGDRAQLNKTLLDLNKSLFSLTASRDREQSFESAEWGGGHGIFTYYVVKGMEGAADVSQDGIVTADELAEYVRNNVREATAGRQTPTSDRGSFDPEMLLAYIPSGRSPEAPPPPKFGTLVVEVNQDGVEVFVNGKSVGIVNKGTPLRLPGLAPGAITVKAVKMGFEPDGPREEMVYPGQESTVSFKIVIPRRRPRAAVERFDSGLEYYNKSGGDNYKKAAAEFVKALAIDPKYSQAALYLGRSHHAQFEYEAAKAAYSKAIEIDPDYLEARASFGGMLLDIGDLDESIRQLNAVTQRDKKNSQAYYLLSQALRRKDLYDEGILAARQAIKLVPENAEAHFWLAENLRMTKKWTDASKEYQEYLRLSDFDSKMAGKLNYYVLGFLAGMGKKKRAAQTDIWRELRSMAYFGLCEAERKQNRFATAIGHCQKALVYDPGDPFLHYQLGLAYTQQANEADDRSLLPAARKHFRAMLDINAELPEAEYARRNLAAIEKAIYAQ